MVQLWCAPPWIEWSALLVMRSALLTFMVCITVAMEATNLAPVRGMWTNIDILLMSACVVDAYSACMTQLFRLLPANRTCLKVRGRTVTFHMPAAWSGEIWELLSFLLSCSWKVSTGCSAAALICDASIARVSAVGCTASPSSLSMAAN